MITYLWSKCEVLIDELKLIFCANELISKREIFVKEGKQFVVKVKRHSTKELNKWKGRRRGMRPICTLVNVLTKKEIKIKKTNILIN